MEVLNDLVGYKLKIYQNTDWFLFSLDSVLLPNFVTINKGVKKILDLGTGNAPIPLILSTRTKASITGVEIQKDLYLLAKKNIEYNKLTNQIEIINEDIKELKKLYESDTFDIITCNPPYFKYSKESHLNEDEHKVIARHEKSIKIEDIITISKYLLKNNGILALVHRTDRLIEIINICEKNNLQIKRLRFIYPKEKEESNMVLVEARKNAGIGLKILSPLYVHEENGDYTKEVLEMFKEKGE